LIKCWIEDWVVDAVASINVVAQAKIFCKYGGLQFNEIDKKCAA